MPRTAQLLLLALLCAALPAYAFTLISDAKTRQLISASAIVSILGFFATRYLIPAVASKTASRGICGKDLNKKGTPAGEVPIPEAAGLAVGCVFLLCIICFEHLHYYDLGSLAHWVASGFKGPSPRLDIISDAWLVDYNAALATIGFMLFLGFADDVLDIRWRVKLMLPMFAALPLLAAYSGGTGIAVPKPLQALAGLPAYMELGLLYKLYMVLLAIFCTNSINILAGVNGLEAGQTLVVAAAILAHNLLSVATHPAAAPGQGAGGGGAAAGAYPSVRDGHLFSAYLMMPLAACSLALLTFNWYPSRVFVGDSFTYFAGMAIAVAGILGHFSETLLLFLLPQIFNFVYSLPQLFKIVPCPRHRLPVFDPKTGLLRPKPAPDWNLVNLMLQVAGPCSENALCVRLLLLQAGCCLAGFGVRWLLTGVYK
ncbi:glycosyl transferase family 4-domain-containing protein [Haematococcus lacustris]